MEKLHSLIAFLPSEVTGRDVYSFLALSDLVRLDSAVTNRMIRRSVVYGAFAVTSVQIKTLMPHAWLDQAWSWCLKRGIHLDDMDIWDVNKKNVEILIEVLSRLTNNDTNVRWNCEVNKCASQPKSKSYRMMDRSEIIGKISHVRLSGQPSDNSIVDLCRNMLHLRSVSLVDINASEQTLCDIMDAVPPLVELWLPQGHFGEKSLNSLLRHAATLKALSITYDGRISALLTILGQNCVHLVKIFLLHKSSERVVHDSEQETGNGLMAMAKGCRNLRYAALNCPHLRAPVLLAIAQHCPDLQRLEFGWYDAELTNAVLLALAGNCPQFCDWSGLKWRVTSIDAVEAAKSLLQRLVPFSMSCDSAPSSASAAASAVARALCYSRARTVRLSGVTEEYATVLSQCPVSLSHCDSFFLRCSFPATHSAAALDPLLMSVAATSGTRLRELSIYGATVSDAAFIALAEHCPNLNRVILEQSAISETTMVAAVQRWPQLTFLLIAGNASISAAVLDALAAHCPMLKIMRLDLNKVVTALEVMAFVTRLPAVQVGLPRRFTTEDRAMVHAAVSAAKEQSAMLTR